MYPPPIELTSPAPEPVGPGGPSGPSGPTSVAVDCLDPSENTNSSPTVTSPSKLTEGVKVISVLPTLSTVVPVNVTSPVVAAAAFIVTAP